MSTLNSFVVSAVTIVGAKHLSFTNGHNPTMNLLEEKQGGLIPPGLQSWLL